MSNLIERIHSRCIEEGECWIWQGCCSSHERPQMRHNGKTEYVRHLAYEEHRGAKAQKGRRVTTTCETPRCVCPEHMTAMKVSDHNRRVSANSPNRAARVLKMTAAKRSASKLTMEQVKEIRESAGTLVEIAAKYGLHYSSVGNIRNGRRWADNTFAGLMR